MPRIGSRHIPSVAIVLAVAALFVLPLLLFIGQMGFVITLGLLLVIVVGAAVWTRGKTPSD